MSCWAAHGFTVLWYYVAGTLLGLVGSGGGGACDLVPTAAHCSAARVSILCSFHSSNHGFYFAVYKCLISHFHLPEMLASELYRRVPGMWPPWRWRIALWMLRACSLGVWGHPCRLCLNSHPVVPFCLHFSSEPFATNSNEESKTVQTRRAH